MKRLAILLVVLAACSSGTRTTSTGDVQLTGAAAPRLAVEKFLAAIRAQDLQAMATVWGSEKGPARDVVDRSQLEKRELIMQCYLSHDRFTIVGEQPGRNATHDVRVSLTKGKITREATFTTVRGPGDRWYVEDVPLEPVRDLCASP